MFCVKPDFFNQFLIHQYYNKQDTGTKPPGDLKHHPDYAEMKFPGSALFRYPIPHFAV